MSKIVDEIQWLERLLDKLGVCVPTPITLFCDNMATPHIAENPCFHERTKHLRSKHQKLDVHYIREKVSGRSHFLCSCSFCSSTCRHHD